MASVFEDSNLWQQATFTFSVVDESTSQLNDRGHKIAKTKTISVTFKMKPKPTRIIDATTTEHNSAYNPRYDCRVVAVDNDKEKVRIPSEIKVNDVGEGVFNERNCRASIVGLGQSSLSPILTDILGASAELELNYSTGRASTR